MVIRAPRDRHPFRRRSYDEGRAAVHVLYVSATIYNEKSEIMQRVDKGLKHSTITAGVIFVISSNVFWAASEEWRSVCRGQMCVQR